jgi:hypothetical protein
VRAAGEWAILCTRNFGLHRAADGTRFAGNGAGIFGDSTPIVVGDMI